MTHGSVKAGPAPDGINSPARKILLSATVSAVGDGFTIVAFGLLAMRATSDARLIAAVFVAERLPWVVGLRLARLVDRCPRPGTILVAADLGRACVLAAAAAFVTVAGPNIPILCVAGALLGLGTLFHSAARSALLPTLGSGPELAKLNGYLCSLEGLGYAAIGPALGGLVFALGATLPLALDAATFLVSATCLLALRDTPVHAERANVAPAQIGVVRFVVAHPILRLLFVHSLVLGFAQAIVLSVTPLFVRSTLGVEAGWYGVFLGVAAIGGITTGFVTPHMWADRRNTTALVIGAGLAAGLAYVALADQRTAVAAVAMLFVFDSTVGITSTVSPTLRLELAPADARGTTATLFRQAILGTQPAGALLSGLLARAHGVRLSITLAGGLVVVCFVLTALPFRRAVAMTGA